MNKHAPAPFKIRREGRGRLLIKATHSDGKEYAIAQMMAGAFGTETANATARLFTAAPELLGMAESVLLCFSNDEEWWTEMAENDCPNNISSDERRRQTLEQLREVITKVRGEIEVTNVNA